jgi:hypothetical protein
MAKKPYIYESLEGWLQITRKKSWYDPVNNPGDLAPYSEFQRPYINDRDMSYPEWEWSWPTSTWPPIDDISWPDPIDNCSIDEDCVWAGLIGPEEMECDQCFTWSQAHLWLGCGDAPWWAAFGTWSLVEKQFTTGDCKFLFQGPVMATVCCDDDAVGRFSIRYDGALDCVGEMEVEVTCGCCQAFSITGAETVNPGEDWTGVIDPPCPGSTCSVMMTASDDSACTSGCAVNGSGSLVTVSAGTDDCGGIRVTVTDTCEENSASADVRINNTGQGGAWGSGCGQWSTIFCPTAGCPVVYVYYGWVRAVLKCGNLGADCDPEPGCRTATGSMPCAGTEYCWGDVCACDGINQTSLDIWTCPDCEA